VEKAQKHNAITYIVGWQKHKREQAKHLIFLVIFSTKIQVHMLFWGYTFTQIIH